MTSKHGRAIDRQAATIREQAAELERLRLVEAWSKRAEKFLRELELSACLDNEPMYLLAGMVHLVDTMPGRRG